MSGCLKYSMMMTDGVRCMPCLDTTREFFKCAMCGEMKNMDSYIAPRGVHAGERICRNCYRNEFAKQYGDEERVFACERCHLATPVSDMHTDSDGCRYCGECWTIIADSYFTEDAVSTDDAPNNDSNSEIGDLVKAVYELNDSVKDLTSLLKSRL